MNEQKNENDVIRIANLLAEHGYDIREVKQKEGIGEEITVKVYPVFLASLEKDTCK